MRLLLGFSAYDIVPQTPVAAEFVRLTVPGTHEAQLSQ